MTACRPNPAPRGFDPVGGSAAAVGSDEVVAESRLAAFDLESQESLWPPVLSTA